MNLLYLIFLNQYNGDYWIIKYNSKDQMNNFKVITYYNLFISTK